MKIQSLTLHDYRLFRVSGIRTFTAQFVSDTQVITGANGSGKTSLLNEISLLPQPRSLYGPEGKKVLTLTHEKSAYVLETDYAKKIAPHGFLKDGEELNPSGTTAIQEDLVRTHLGHDRVHDPILRGRLDIAGMQLALRKSLFMTLSPFNLSTVLKAHKTVSRKQKDVTATLAHLQARDQVLKDSRLPEDDLKALLSRKVDLQETVSRTVEYVHRLEEILRSRLETSFRPLDEIRTALSDLKTRIPVPDRIDSRDPEGQLSVLSEGIARMEERLVRTEDGITRLLDDISLYDTNLKDMQKKRAASLLDREIRSLAEEISLLEADPLPDPFPAPLHDTYATALQGIQEAAHHLVGAETLLDGASYRRKVKGLARRRPEADVLRDRLTQIETDLRSLGSGVSAEDLPRENCAQAACPLWRTFMETRNRNMSRRCSLEAAQGRFQRRLERLNRYVRAVTQCLENAASTRPFLQVIHETLKRYPDLQGSRTDAEVFHLLKTDPLRLPRELSDRLTRSRSQARAAALREEMDGKIRETQALDGVRLDQEQAVTALRDRTLSRLEAERVTQRSLLETLEVDRDLQKRLRSWTAVTRDLASLRADLETSIAKSPLPYERQVLETARTLLLRIRDETISEIGEIDHQLREQDRLQARWEAEVQGQAIVKEKEARELAHVEAALSPFHGIPHDYLIAFLDALILRANVFIGQVFTYPFELLPLDPALPLDYRFPVLADGVRIDDISQGSDAQKEMVNLAFILAFMDVLDLSDRPLVLDEVGRAFDIRHRQNLLPLFREARIQGVLSTLFLVNHNETVLAGLDANVICLSEKNILLPEVYNEHVVLS